MDCSYTFQVSYKFQRERGRVDLFFIAAKALLYLEFCLKREVNMHLQTCWVHKLNIILIIELKVVIPCYSRRVQYNYSSIFTCQTTKPYFIYYRRFSTSYDLSLATPRIASQLAITNDYKWILVWMKYFLSPSFNILSMEATFCST